MTYDARAVAEEREGTFCVDGEGVHKGPEGCDGEGCDGCESGLCPTCDGSANDPDAGLA